MTYDMTFTRTILNINNDIHTYYKSIPKPRILIGWDIIFFYRLVSSILMIFCKSNSSR